MIKKVKGGYKAATKGGRPLSKKPKTKSGARKQLRAVEASKRKKATPKKARPKKGSRYA